MAEQEKDRAALARAARVAALEAERNGYVRRGLTERVKLVDDQIAAAKGVVSGRKPR